MPADINVLSVIGLFLFVTVLAFALIALATSLVRFQFMVETNEGAEANVSGPDEALKKVLFQKIVKDIRGRDSFSVMMFECTAGDEAVSADQAKAFREKLQSVIRYDDRLFSLEEAQGWALFFPAVPERLDSLVTRVKACVREMSWSDTVRNFDASWRLSLVRYPEEGETVQELYDAARRALEQGSPSVVTPREDLDKETVDADDDAAPRGIDPVTGVINQSFLIGQLRKFIAKYRREDFPVSVVAMDVDQFDMYNQRYGKDVGDRVLEEVADVLMENIREADFIARGKGDEFILGFGVPPNYAEEISRRLAAKIQGAIFDASANKLRLTVSCGVAGYPDIMGTAAEYVEAAGSPLRKAGPDKKNVVLRYTPEEEPGASDAQPRDVF